MWIENFRKGQGETPNFRSRILVNSTNIQKITNSNSMLLTYEPRITIILKSTIFGYLIYKSGVKEQYEKNDFLKDHSSFCLFMWKEINLHITYHEIKCFGYSSKCET